MKSRQARIEAKQKSIDVLQAKETRIRNQRMKLEQQVKRLREQCEAARDVVLLEYLKDRLREHPEEREALEKSLADRELTDEQRMLFNLPPRDADRAASAGPNAVTDATRQTPQPAANHADEETSGTQDAAVAEADPPDAAPDAATDKPPEPVTKRNRKTARARKKAVRPAKASNPAAVEADQSDAPAETIPPAAASEANHCESPPPAASVEPDQPDAPAETIPPAAASEANHCESPPPAAVEPDHPDAPAEAIPPAAASEANYGQSSPPAASVEEKEAPAEQDSPRPVEGHDPAAVEPAPPATDPQLGFIRRLIARDPDAAQKIGISPDSLPTLSKRKASWVIRALQG